MKRFRLGLGGFIKINFKKIFIFLTVLFLISTIYFGISHWQIHRYSRDKIINSIENLPASPVGIVLGAAVYRDTLSPVLHDRAYTAVLLYRQKKIQKILVSGDHGRKSYDEVNAVKKFLLKHDIKAQDIFLDYAGFSTFDSMARAAKVFQIKQAVIITQDFHLRRSIYLARQHGIDAVGYPADRQEYLYIKQYHAREALAKVKAFSEVLWGKDPKYLGKVIDIAGDGRQSWDASAHN